MVSFSVVCIIMFVGFGIVGLSGLGILVFCDFVFFFCVWYFGILGFGHFGYFGILGFWEFALYLYCCWILACINIFWVFDFVALLDLGNWDAFSFITLGFGIL